MNQKIIASYVHNLKLSLNISIRFYSVVTKSINNEVTDLSNVELKPVYEQSKYTEEELNKIRDKSKLAQQHKNILNGKMPYTKSLHFHHDTLKYKRRMIAKYGIKAAGVNPGIAWPSIEEVEDMKEYEKVAYPVSIQEGWKLIEKKHKEEAAKIQAREAELEEKLAKVEKWKNDLIARIEKKEKQVLEAKARKDRLIEEVRQHFGFKIDTKDARFKEMLEQKEKEDKKRRKQAKKEEKALKFMAKLKQMQEQNAGNSTKEEPNENKFTPELK